MTDAGTTVVHVRLAVSDAFDRVDAWFDTPRDVRLYRPADSGWTVDEVLEHIGLTAHYLLVIIKR